MAKQKRTYTYTVICTEGICREMARYDGIIAHSDDPLPDAIERLEYVPTKPVIGDRPALTEEQMDARYGSDAVLFKQYRWRLTGNYAPATERWRSFGVRVHMEVPQQ